MYEQYLPARALPFQFGQHNGKPAHPLRHAMLHRQNDENGVKLGHYRAIHESRMNFPKQKTVLLP
jgi:hypothetical protein